MWYLSPMPESPSAGLDSPPSEPLELFDRWYADARAHERHELTAMTLATADSDGRPSARIVLLKHHDAGGFDFYTNFGSRKAADLESNPQAALLFWFPVLQRQIRIEGPVARVPEDEADAYFATRPRGAQLGAWASKQSRDLDSRATLERRLAEADRRFEHDPVPRPPHWGGWRLRPERYEFWHEGAARLHDRIEYTRTDGNWHARRLYP